METFHWKVRPDMNVVSEPKVVTVKLGDGYEQRRAAGLNNQLSTYSVTIRVRKGEHPSLKSLSGTARWRPRISVDATL